jgi:hypothetical protein
MRKPWMKNMMTFKFTADGLMTRETRNEQNKADRDNEKRLNKPDRGGRTLRELQYGRHMAKQRAENQRHMEKQRAEDQHKYYATMRKRRLDTLATIGL